MVHNPPTPQDTTLTLRHHHVPPPQQEANSSPIPHLGSERNGEREVIISRNKERKGNSTDPTQLMDHPPTSERLGMSSNPHNRNPSPNRGRYVVNLSREPLTEEALDLLDKGLNFGLSGLGFSPHSPYKDPYIRKLRWIDFFRHHASRDRVRHPLCQPSKEIPPPASSRYEAYFERLGDRLSQLQPTIPSMNLTSKETETLRELKANSNIVINKADKGSCIVIEDSIDYVRNGREHLSNKDIYTEIEFDYTSTLTKRINDEVKHSCLDQITKDYIQTDPSKVRTQRMYFLKKIHKNPHGLRPIVSGTSGPTEKISHVVDLSLKKALKTIPSYIQDTKHFVNIVENTKLPKNALLVTLDVTGLYLNIPQEEGIRRTLDYHFTHFPHETMRRKTLHNLMRIILRFNIFEFGGRMYKQTCGTAMGTKFAPTFANLFMASVERDFLQSQAKKPIVWKRYIDDIFMIWTHGRESLDKFISDLNKHHPNLKYTFHIQRDMVEFLDASVYKGPRFATMGILDIEPFFKPTNKFQYTHFQSCHPPSTFKGVVKAETIRMLRLSSSPSTYQNKCRFLANRFKERGYPHKLINVAMQEVPFHLRESYLETRETQELPADRVPFVCPYQQQIGSKVLRKAIWDEVNDGGIEEQPLIAFTKSRTVGRGLVSSLAGSTERPRKAGQLLPGFPTLPKWGTRR